MIIHLIASKLLLTYISCVLGAMYMHSNGRFQSDITEEHTIATYQVKQIERTANE